MMVRTASIGDANDLFELNTLFGNNATVEFIRESLAENGDQIVVIAYIGDVAAGFCCGHAVKSMCYRSARADIEALYVREQCRRQGIGRALISRLESEFMGRGISHFHITTRAANASALSLYERVGYIRFGEVLLEKTITD